MCISDPSVNGIMRMWFRILLRFGITLLQTLMVFLASICMYIADYFGLQSSCLLELQKKSSQIFRFMEN